MHVQNIFLAFLPLRQASMRMRGSALALFGYGNEWLLTANEERDLSHVTMMDRLVGVVQRGALVKTSGQGTAHSV